MKKKGGIRPGAGRKMSVPNKSTVEAAAEAAQKAIEAKINKKKLAVDVLQGFMERFAAMTDRFEPWPKARGRNKHANRELFDRYAKLTVETAAELAPYQTPKLRVIGIGAVAPEIPLPVAPRDGDVSRLTPAESYRLMRDATVLTPTKGPAQVKRLS